MCCERVAKKATEHLLCNRCLGRLFARIGRDLSNEARGKAIRFAIAEGLNVRNVLENIESYRSKIEEAVLHEMAGGEVCEICGGMLKKIEHYARLVYECAKGIEFDTFLIGCKVSPVLIEREEDVWAKVGAVYHEPIKSEINREVGKIVSRSLGAKMDRTRPDVVFIVDTEVDTVITEIRSVFILGRYRKLVRGIPQTKWPCRACRGVGCPRCNYTGKMYEDSVEELVAKKVVEVFEAEGQKFHGMGREDIDARMLGNGRPFVLEVCRPKKRRVDLGMLERIVNSYAKGKVEVMFYRFGERCDVVRVKSFSYPKTYKAVVKFDGEVAEEKLKEVLNNLSGRTIVQETPSRVSHRRARKERKRKVHSARLLSLTSSEATIEIVADAGMYIKELVNGDAGRTRPSIAGMLGISCSVKALDVVKIHDEVGQWLSGPVV